MHSRSGPKFVLGQARRIEGNYTVTEQGHTEVDTRGKLH
jgi:hypothetical protein